MTSSGTTLDADAAGTLDLRDYIALLRRRRWIVAQTVVLVLIVATGFTFLQTPIFEASARLVIEAVGSDAEGDALLTQLIVGRQEIETEREVVTSSGVAERVAEAMGEEETSATVTQGVSVAIVGETQVLSITARATDPERAAALAQTFAEQYLEYRRERALDRALEAASALEARAERTEAQLDEVQLELRTATGSDLEVLRQEEVALLAQLGQLSAQLAALQAPETFVSGGGNIIRAAAVPSDPSSPRPARTAVLATVLGLMLGVGLAFVRDYLDDTIRSDEDAAALIGAPVLGHIPRWQEQRVRGLRLVSLVAPASPVAEAYRTLRTNIRFLSVSRSFRSLLVTSASSADGKTTTAANLAVTAARAGGRVLLVSVDLRRPGLHKVFGLGEGPGLSDVLAGEVELLDAITDVGVPNLRVIPSGHTPPNPAELLGSATMVTLMRELEQIADLVLYDGPPVLAVADALELAPRTGGVLVVVDAGRSGRRPVRAAVERINGVGGAIVGSVLNNVDPNEAYYYSYYYTEYGASPPNGEATPTPVASERR